MGSDDGAESGECHARSVRRAEATSRDPRPCRQGTPGEWLAEHEAKAILATSGIVFPEGGVAHDVDEALRLAAGIPGAVALKLSAADLQHKSDVGALELNVAGEDQIAQAFARLRAIDGHSATPVLVEAMSEPGVELLISARRDAVVPVLVVGLGGVWVEIASDVAVIPLPVTAQRVGAALRQLRGRRC